MKKPKQVRKFLADDSIPEQTSEELMKEYQAERAKPFEERDIELLVELAMSVIEMGEEGVAVQTAEDLERLYDAELQKPLKKRDLDLMGELARLIMDLRGIKVNPPPFETIQRLANEREVKRKRTIRRTCLTAACVAVILILPLNLAAESAYGMNIFSAVVRIVRGGMDFNFNKPIEVIELPTSIDDPHGLRAECEKHGMDVLLPTYIPSGLMLTGVGFEENEIAEIKHIDFHYKNAEQRLNINISQYSQDLPENFQVPLDSKNLEELMIDGRQTFIMKEKSTYRVTFKRGADVYGVEAQNIEYTELMVVLYSFR